MIRAALKSCSLKRGNNYSALGQVFNFKLCRFAIAHSNCIAYKQPLLELKTQFRFCPESHSLFVNKLGCFRTKADWPTGIKGSPSFGRSHFAGRHLVKKDIWPKNVTKETFGQKDIWLKRHLAKKTFGPKETLLINCLVKCLSAKWFFALKSRHRV